jgi:PAS domain S-box-containing protein
MDLSAIPLAFIPLAFASAIVRYRLMDVEVILKRLLVYTSVVAAIAVIYILILRTSGGQFAQTEDQHRWLIAFLATVIVLLLARPVKDAVQSAIDRVFYRDRYDYRRALVGFARDLNSDLDLDRLSERLVARIRETFVIDRMALFLVNEGSGDYEVIRVEGFGDLAVSGLGRHSQLAASLAGGIALSLDDPRLHGAFPVEELAFWRVRGVHYFVPCVSKGGTIAVLALGQRGQGEPLSSEDMGLLSAVGSHVATALENGRLYRQLQVKAGELQRLQEFNENIVESLDDGLVVEDLNGRIVRWNRALAAIYGVSDVDARGHKLDEVFDGPFVEALRAAQRDSPNGASLYRVPLAGRAVKAGERIRVNIATVPLRAPSGQANMSTVGNIIIIENVTERVHLEEQLQISDRMASVGLLAAGVAHEVNTPLTGISSFTFSANGKYLYGSSYYSGVSNIYRYDFDRKEMEIVSNAETGFFRPVPVSEDSLIAMCYTGKGFLPVMLPNQKPEYVNAIQFLGNEVVENHPLVKDWKIPAPASIVLDSLGVSTNSYNTLKDTKLASVYPIVEGYKAYTAAEYLIEVAQKSGIDHCFDAAEGMALATDQRELWEKEHGVALEPDAAKEISDYTRDNWEIDL